MTSEQRLDRLERIATLMVRAEVRDRKREREQDEKINMIIDAQVKNEERFAQIAEAQAENEARFAKLAAYQEHTDQRLDALIDIIRDQRNGKSNS
jgi:hypothetical protein